MIIKSEDYYEAEELHQGYCTTCKDISSRQYVELDAEGYDCPDCGEDTVMGLETAVISGYVEITP